MRLLATIVLPVCLCAVISCSTNRSKQEATKADQPVSQAIPASQPVSEAPAAVVKALYKAHEIKESPFFQAKSRALVDRFFMPELAELIWSDALMVEKTGEMSVLEADPLYNAQDTDIDNFVIKQAQISNEQAEVVVTFTNFGEKQELTYLLEKENNEWLISNLFYGDGSQLFQLLSSREPENR